MLLTRIVRLWIFDYFKGGLGIPSEGQGGNDEKGWARWRKWLAAIESRPSVVNTMSDKEHYMPLYKRYGELLAIADTQVKDGWLQRVQKTVHCVPLVAYNHS